jgi:hypothetical protein
MTYLTLFNYNDQDILVREEDGYFNATAMCKANGKKVADFTRLQWTNEYLYVMQQSMGINIDQIIVTKMDGNNEERGTWMHPLLAFRLAQWLSPEFAFNVDYNYKKITDDNAALANQLREIEQHQHRLLPYKPVNEFDLCGRIMWWANICGVNYKQEHSLVNTVNSKTKNRRIDLIKFNGRNVVAIELKRHVVTGLDLYNAVIDREYVNLIHEHCNRPVKLIMLSPHQAKDEVFVFIKQSKFNIEFQTVNDFCVQLFYKGLSKAWLNEPYYLRNLLFNDIFKCLFHESFIEEQRAIAKIREIGVAA